MGGSRAGAARWIQLQSANFLLAGDVTERDLRDVARHLEEFREALARLLPKSRFARTPTVVLVFPNERAYGPFRPRYNGKPVEVAGYFQGGEDVNYLTILLDARRDAYPIVFHEFAHLFISANLGSVPLWFGEGLAEYYSSFESDGNRARVGKPIDRHVLLLRDRWLPLDQVLAATHVSRIYNDPPDVHTFYAESWAIVHYMLLDAPARTPQLFTFLQRLDAGAPREQACQDAFGVPIAGLERELRGYVQRLSFGWQLIPLSKPIAGRAGAPAQSLAEAAVEARLGDLLLHMNRQAEAEARLQNALRLDPQQLLAHLSLGELRFRQNHASEALTLLERATTRNPDDLAAQLACGRAVLRHAGALPAPEQVATARKSFARALEIAPDSPEALAGMGRARFAADERDLNEARRLVLRAIELDPGEPDHVLLLAQILARQHDFKGARNCLGPLMASPRINVSTEARSLMASLVEYEKRVNSHPDREEVPAGAGRTLYLRRLGAGEQRTFGSLERIECGQAGIFFVVKSGDRTLRLSAARLDAPEFISYRDDLRGNVGCGARQPPDPVYVTWRAAADDAVARAQGRGNSARADDAARSDGVAVAIEFVPKDYVLK